MSKCVFCGQAIPFLRRSHEECRKQHDLAVSKIPDLFVKALASSIEPARFCALIEDLARTHFVAEQELRMLTVKGLRAMINSVLMDPGPSEEQASRIVRLCNEFCVPPSELGAEGQKFTQMALVR
jgi:hypothetical protein